MTASADKTVGVWDVNRGTRSRTLNKHSAVVNSVGLGPGSLIVSGGDDNFARCVCLCVCVCVVGGGVGR